MTQNVTFSLVTFKSLLPEGQKSLLSHFWGHCNYLGARGVLGGTEGHRSSTQSSFFDDTFRRGFARRGGKQEGKEKNDAEVVVRDMC